MNKSAFTHLLAGLQAAASLGLCVLCYLWVQQSREFNRMNGVLRSMHSSVSQNKTALTQMVGDSISYSDKNPAMRNLLMQMGVPLSNPAGAPAARPSR